MTKGGEVEREKGRTRAVYPARTPAVNAKEAFASLIVGRNTSLVVRKNRALEVRFKKEVRRSCLLVSKIG